MQTNVHPLPTLLMIRKHLLLPFIFLAAILTSGAQNPWIQPIVQSVSGDSLFATIADLQAMDRVNTSNSLLPAQYLKQRLSGYDMDTVFFHFYKPNTPPNVVAIRYGTQDPNEYWIMGGHYDAVVPNAGADDNASGTAAVVEMARVIKEYEIEKSLILVLFSAEEVGLWGSKAFADSALGVISIAGMINLDMIAYSHNLEDSSVSVGWKYFADNLMQDFITATGQYVPELHIQQDSTSGILNASDHASFWSHLIPAIFLIENLDRWGGTFNPWYHQYADTIGKGANSKWLAERITQSAIATLLWETDPFSTISIPEPDPVPEILSFYPNPSLHTITLRSSSQNGETIGISLFGPSGACLFTADGLQPGSEVDVSWLPKGVYGIKLISDSKSCFHKFIKL